MSGDGTTPIVERLAAEKQSHITIAFGITAPQSIARALARMFKEQIVSFSDMLNTIAPGCFELEIITDSDPKPPAGAAGVPEKAA